MPKAAKQNEKFQYAIIISVILHIMLIFLLIYSSFNEHIKFNSDGGNNIAAVIIDQSALMGQYNHQQNQRTEQKRQKQTKQQTGELQLKQIAEQQRLKSLEKERLQLHQKTEEKKKQQSEYQKITKTATFNMDIKAQVNAKAKAAEHVKTHAADTKKTPVKAAKESTIDDLLGNLSSDKNAPKSVTAASRAVAGQSNQKKTGALGTEINSYLDKITIAIQNHFYDAYMYRGKSCDLRIKLAHDGLLIDIKSEGGNPALCRAAVIAAKHARIPKPPSEAVYEVFKNTPIHFKPE